MSDTKVQAVMRAYAHVPPGENFDCNMPRWHDFKDDKNPLTLNKGAQAPHGENFDCNESEWREGTAGRTTYALRNACSLFESVCASKGQFNPEAVGRRYSLNYLEAIAPAGGREQSYVIAQPNAPLVSGNLIFRMPYWHDFSDNQDAIKVNLGDKTPRGENFDCNEAAWKKGVHRLTIYLLSNAFSIFGGAGGRNSVNHVDSIAPAGGREQSYVIAQPNAPLVSGNLIFRMPYWHDFSDNQHPIKVNLGARMPHAPASPCN